MTWIEQWLSWWSTLTPAAEFLFALPFLVAAAALLVDRIAHARSGVAAPRREPQCRRQRAR